MIKDERTVTQKAIDDYKAKMRKCIKEGKPMPIADWNPWNPPPRPGIRVNGMGKSHFSKD